MAVNTQTRGVFLDKDGTLVHDAHYNVDPAHMVWYPEVVPALRRLQEAGYLLAVVTNQPGVAFGLFDEHALRELLAHLTRQLHLWGIRLADIRYCPHHPGGNVSAYAIACGCRKPESGMLRSTARAQHISLANSWMVGDILDDVGAGNSAGCRSILIDRGNETVWESGPGRTPLFLAQNLTDAAEYILESDDA